MTRVHDPRQGVAMLSLKFAQSDLAGVGGPAVAAERGTGYEASDVSDGTAEDGTA